MITVRKAEIGARAASAGSTAITRSVSRISQAHGICCGHQTTRYETHGHRDMEIILLDGALAHSDSIGTGSVIRPGDVQKMSAGSGIRHSEFNHSKTDPVHFLQIWIIPDRGRAAGISAAQLSARNQVGKLVLVASEKREDIIHIQQDAKDVSVLESSEQKVVHTWKQVATHGFTLRPGPWSRTARR